MYSVRLDTKLKSLSNTDLRVRKSNNRFFCTCFFHFPALLICLIQGLMGTQQVLAQGSGSSLILNGMDQSVNLGSSIDYSIRTVEMWFKLNQTIDPSNTAPAALLARDFNSGDRRSIHEFHLCFYPKVVMKADLFFLTYR